jgi:L-cystine uptake protein TcyP (sodium:dicarboxylate symporter family)
MEDKTIFKLVILILALLIFGLILVAWKLKTGKPVRAIARDNPQLFLYSFWTAVAILFIVFGIFVAVNN